MPFAGTRQAEGIDARLAVEAAPQHGILTGTQLRHAGLSAAAIKYRLKIGRLHRIHRGVYAVGHRPPSPHARAMAAVLACGPGAALSHRSAAALWGITPTWHGAVDVTAPTKRDHRGVNCHRSRTLRDEHVTVHFGIPVTTLARTILDLTDVLDERALARAVNAARLRGLTVDRLAELVATARGRATRRLDPLLRDAAPTRSDFEDAFVAFTERFGLPRPEPNEKVAGVEVDMLWREQRLIVELDSRRYHDHALAFEADRERDATLLAAGFRTVRVTWARLHGAPAREAARLRELLR